MEEKKNSQIARILAVLALAGTILVVIVVVSGVAGGGDDGPTQRTEKSKQQAANKPKTKKKTYVVQSGDNLTIISEKTGISVERLQRLNRDIDPQALQLGQTLKLR